MKNISFLKFYRTFIFLSLSLIIVSIFFLFNKGLNLGVDFKGGTLLEIQVTKTTSSESIRSQFIDLNLGDVKVKEFGDSNIFLAILEKKNNEKQYINNLKKNLEKKLNDSIDFRRVEIVGPKVSSELSRSGLYAISISLIFILIYIWFRFEWQFSIGAIVALLHDVLLTLGIFSITSIEFNLSIIAAVLTIVGYSINDTVVIYDRIRENLKKDENSNLIGILNISINETLPRTLKTSLTTLLALIAIYIFGGEILRGFSFALIWGVIIGTYSSIFIASPILLILKVKRNWDEVIDNTP
tara:strand:+ start:767 stop:1660 length:894 start_codon:yes stop_codon:yes gene_type:complete